MSEQRIQKATILVRAEPKVKERLQAAAKADRIPLSTWLRRVGLQRADELLGKEKGKAKSQDRS